MCHVKRDEKISAQFFYEWILKQMLSAVSAHLIECNCPIDFDHFDILASNAYKFRLIREILLIKRDQPQLNKTSKSFPLKLFDWGICR